MPAPESLSAVAFLRRVRACVVGGGRRGGGTAAGPGFWPFCSCGDRPSVVCGAESEDGEARQVGCGSEEVEVGVDLWSSADAGASSAVAAAHEVGELAFDLGPVGAV